MQNLSPRYTLFVIAISSPVIVGVYKNNKLVNSTKSQKKTSEVLLSIVMDYIEKYNISKMIYTRGPGSYMSIKLTYIMLKTVEMLRGIPLFSCSGFDLNGNQPIKAIGNLYFFKEKETIMTKKIEYAVDAPFVLPQTIFDLIIDKESSPEYNLPAV